MLNMDMKSDFKKLYEEGLGISKENGEYLYHYTTYESAINILKSGSIYAGRAHSMEDAEEIKYCYKLAEKILEQQFFDKEFIASVLSRLENEDLIFKELRHYILSFSKDENNLFDWKKHSKKQGVIFKIAYENIKQLNSKLYFRNSYGKLVNFKDAALKCKIYGDYGNVIYERSIQEEILLQEINKFYYFYKAYRQLQDFNSFFDLLIFRIKLIAPYFKKSQYRNENELRIVYTLYGPNTSDEGIEISKELGGKNKSFVELIFHDLWENIYDALGIREILLSEDKFKAEAKSLKVLLKDFGYEADINISKKIF